MFNARGWFQQVLRSRRRSRKSAATSRAHAHSLRPTVERLEDRALLAVVTVDVGHVVRTVNNHVLGTNLAWWDSSLNTAQTLSMVQAAGLSMFRFPGGSSSDEWHFNNPPSYNGQGTSPSMASFIASTGGAGMVTLDYGSASPQESAALLAYFNGSTSNTTNIGFGQQWSTASSTWVTKDWKTAGYWASLRAAAPLATDDGLNFLRLGRAAPFAFHYYEVGNEIYGSWETDHHGQGGDTGGAHDPATYVAFAKQFAAYATLIDTSISIGVVTGSIGYDNNWTSNVLQQGVSQGFTPGFLSDHQYMQGPGNESDSFLLLNTVSNPNGQDANSPYDWALRAAGYRNLLTQKLGAAGAGVELLATEFNSVYANPGKQSTSLVNGLFVADSLGSILGTEYNAADVWDLRNGWGTGGNNASSLYGWRLGGDYGLLGSGSGLAPSTGAYVPYPNYFAEQLVAKMAHSGDSVVQATSDNLNLAAYAVKQLNGHLDLLVINKSSNTDLAEQIRLTGFTPSGQAAVWQYGKTQDTAQSATSDGHSALANFAQTLAVSGTNFTLTFPQYSMTVLDLSPSNPPSGWSDRDIGGPGVAGAAGYESSSGIWTISGGGSDIWNNSDLFHFASQTLLGNGNLVARVTSLANTDPWAKGGVMFRDSTAAGATYAAVVATPGNGVSFQWRSATDGGSANAAVGSLTAPVWVKLVRGGTGSSFSGLYSTDNVTWIQIGGTQSIAMSTSALAGLAVTAHNNATISTATFTSATVTAVNDPPSFTAGANQTVNEGAGPQTVANWATNLSPGPSDESGQALNFIVSNNNNNLFSAQPAISASGKLTYTPATGASGTATVTVQLHDNGGTANGGVDTSAAQTCTITVLPVNLHVTTTADSGPGSLRQAILDANANPTTAHTIQFWMSTGSYLFPLGASWPTISGAMTIRVETGMTITLAGPSALALAAGAALTKDGPGTLSITAPQSNAAGSVWTATAGTLNFTTDAGSNSTVNANSAVNFTGTQHVAALSIGPNTTVTLTRPASSSQQVLVSGALSLTPTSDLDLKDNSLVVHGGGNPTGTFAAVEAAIKSAFNNFNLNGHGIKSSLIVDATVTGLGSALNSLLAATFAPLNSINGQPLVLSDTIARYTYMGDATLDGVVNDDDASIIGGLYDNGHSTGRHWFEGDFTHDGLVNDDDVSIIGGNYNPAAPPLAPSALAAAAAAQGASNGATPTVATPRQASPVGEPANAAKATNVPPAMLDRPAWTDPLPADAGRGAIDEDLLDLLAAGASSGRRW